jgi:hypothetical protein
MSEETSTDAAPAQEAQEADPAQEQTFSLDYVQQLRAEAAKYRQDKKTAVKAAEDAITSQWQTKLDAAGAEYADLKNQSATNEIQVMRYQAMIDQGIPVEVMPDVISLVGGHDEETVAASVAAAKKLLGATARDAAVDPMQGSGNRTPALNSDELEDSLRRALGIQ